MPNKLPLFATALCAGLMNHASAQLVFVPDLNFRAYLNGEMPNVVDANGYINSASAVVLAAESLVVDVDWSPADLTGIEAFTQAIDLELTLADTVATPLTLSAWPPAMQSLWFAGKFSIAALPPWPASAVDLSVSDLVDLTTVPALPASVTDLGLLRMPNFQTVPPLPTGISSFRLGTCPLVNAVPDLPNSMSQLNLAGLALDTMPPLPDTVNFMMLDFLDSLVWLPQLPSVVTSMLYIVDNPLLQELPPLPHKSKYLTLDRLPLVTRIGVLPTDVQHLTITEVPLDCLPLLPAVALDVELDATNITCLPNIPPGMTTVDWNGTVTPVAQIERCNLVNTYCEPLFNRIIGRVCVDQNGNGFCDDGEPPYMEATVQIAPDGWVSGVAQSGLYAIGVLQGTHTITCDPNNLYPQSVLPLQHSATFTGLDGLDTLNDFAVTLQPNIQDLEVDLTSFGPVVLGVNRSYAVQYGNVGTQVMDGSAVLTLDPALIFVSSVPAPDVIGSNTLTWNFAQLAIGEKRVVNMVLTTAAGVTLGTDVLLTASVEPSVTDETPGNNSSGISGTVLGSFDPNDKLVQPSSLLPTQVTAGERVTYTVRFQNTGTYQAFRIVLTDTLSSDLQWNTMQFVAASHAHTWFIADGVLHVVYDNINLPDSNANEPESHGFFKFSMKPVSTLMLGDAVSNTANIYFDLNEPVITNAAEFLVDANVGIADAVPQGMRLSPNPVNDALTILLEQPVMRAAVHVVDVTGRTVLRTTINGTRTVLDVHALKSGSYHMRVGGQPAARFVKE